MKVNNTGIMVVRRGDIDTPNKLAIGVCTLGLMRVEVIMPLMFTGVPLGQAQTFFFIRGYGIQDARNIAWAGAEGQEWEYFMFWDDDVIAPGAAVETMLETMEQNPEIDILGGVYPARQSIPSPIVLKDSGGSPWWGWEDGGIHKVWMTGTGFTMYRMASIKKIPAPEKTVTLESGREVSWREYFRLDDGTDDYALAVEAEKAGLNWYVHGQVVAQQIEPQGKLFRVEDARHRIGGKNGSNKGQDNSGNHDSGPASIRPGEGRRPADIPAG